MTKFKFSYFSLVAKYCWTVLTLIKVDEWKNRLFVTGVCKKSTCLRVGLDWGSLGCWANTLQRHNKSQLNSKIAQVRYHLNPIPSYILFLGKTCLSQPFPLPHPTSSSEPFLPKSRSVTLAALHQHEMAKGTSWFGSHNSMKLSEQPVMQLSWRNKEIHRNTVMKHFDIWTDRHLDRQERQHQRGSAHYPIKWVETQFRPSPKIRV